MGKSTQASPRALMVTRIDQLLGSLRQAGPLDTHDEALGQVALRLAKSLDSDAAMPVRDVVAVTTALRSTMAELTKGRGGGGDDGDDFTGSLPAPVWDAQEP